MDFLRRVLGRSANSSAQPSNEIVITRDDSVPAPPQEPVIEIPKDIEKAIKKQSLAPVQEEAVKPTSDSSLSPPGATRPLPPLEAVIPKPGQRMIFGQLSDVGIVRGNNQDAVFGMVASSTSSESMPDFGLFIVADGMGGHQDGEKASAITARIISKYVINEIFTALLGHEMHDSNRPTIVDVLRDAVQKANEAVSEQIPEGGTTATTTVILGDLAYVAHVGDSRAYLITDEGIEQITRDHTLVQRLIELDQLTPEEAAEHPQRNVLYRAIGQNDNLDVDAITRRLPPGSRLMLCSDGLWNLVPEDSILDIVTKHNDPQDACNQLIKMANDRGGSDNITVVIVQMPG